MKKRSLWVLPVAAAFVLAGCGSNAGTEAETGSSEAPQQQESTGVPALSAEQAAAVAKTLGGGGENVQVLDSEALSGSLESAKGLIDQMEIKPEKCAEYVSQQGTQDLEGINMAVAIEVNATGESNSYSVAGYEDASKLDTVKKMIDAKDLQGCDEFAMSVAGQEVSASAQILEADSDADSTIATHTAVVMNGTEVPGGSYQIQGVVGENVVSVSQTITAEQSDDEAVKALVEELNKAVEEVKAAAK